MKKSILLFSALAISTLVNAQTTTYFSQNIGLNIIPSGMFEASGVGTVKLPSGGFIAVTVDVTGGFEYKQFSSSGLLLFTSRVAAGSYRAMRVSTVEMLTPTKLLVTGLADDGITTGVYYYVATINLMTNEVVITTKASTNFSYTYGPKVSIGTNDLYVIYPEYSKFDLAKYDFNLNNKWTRDMEGSTSGKNPGNDVDRRDDSTIIVIGKCNDEVGWAECDSSGQADTIRLFHAGAYTRMYGMCRLIDNNVVIAGLYMDATTNPVIAKLDNRGNTIWAKTLDYLSAGTFARFVDAIELSDGRIVALATTAEAYSDTYFDGLVVFAADGTLQKTITLGDAQHAYKFYEAKAYTDGILLSGIVTESGITNNYMIFTDFEFNQICDQAPANTVPANKGMGTVESLGSGLFVSYTGVPTITSNVGTLAVIANGPTSFCTTTTGIDEEQPTGLVNVYPNPVESGYSVTLSMENSANYTVNVIDITGNIVSTQAVSGNRATLSTTGYSSGAYMMMIFSQGKIVYSQKLMIR